MLIFFETIKTIILPPSFFIILLVIGLACWKKRLLSFSIISFATVTLYLLSLSIVTLTLAKPLQHYPALSDKVIVNAHAQAIVVLSGGRYKNAPEYGRDVASAEELMRLQYAAYLYRKARVPILVSGGFCSSQDKSEAQIMAEVLERDFKVPVRWIENASENTWQNAKYSIAILKANHIHRAFLVTTAIHIPRSVLSFQHFEFDVVAAPTRFFISKESYNSWANFLPDPEALRWSTFCLYEYLGLTWYKIKMLVV